MKLRPLKFRSETNQWCLVLSRMLYQNLRSIGSGLMVRSTSNSLDLLSSSFLFFLPSFLFFSLLAAFFSFLPLFLLAPLPLRFWLIFFKNYLPLFFLPSSSFFFLLLLVLPNPQKKSPHLLPGKPLSPPPSFFSFLLLVFGSFLSLKKIPSSSLWEAPFSPPSFFSFLFL